MLKHRHIDGICWLILGLSLLLALLFGVAAACGLIDSDSRLGYEERLFTADSVHSIDIVMEDWDAFLATCTDESYVSCTVWIDGEAYKNVAIRAKGNTSLSSVAAYGNNRYSFKIEFDHYTAGNSYYGLDKLSLNNLIQDNTYLKDYLCYTMMRDMGVAAPLCSFVYITVNGEDWGLYLAVEGVEDGFLQRNYGTDYGELYKPDSMNFGGGRGNGQGFDPDSFFTQSEDGAADTNAQQEDGFALPFSGDASMDTQTDWASMQPPDEESGAGRDFAGSATMGSSDVMLQYIDDDPDSYANIFDNAKTEISDADKQRLIASLKTLSSGEDVESVVDIETVIRYFVVHNFVCNDDSYTGSMVHNYYLYEEDGVLSMIPWDYNLAFGGFSVASSSATAEVNAPIDSPVGSADISERPMVAWIFSNAEYTELYHQYYAEFIETYFSSGYFVEMLEQVVALISPYVQQDPTAFCTYEEFTSGVATLQEFCLLRADSVSGQLAGTIPSTYEEQLSNSEALIDASHLSLSDMGGFSSGGNMAGNIHTSGEDGGRQSFAPGSPPDTASDLSSAMFEDRTASGEIPQTSSSTAEQWSQQWEQSSDSSDEQEAEAADQAPDRSAGAAPDSTDEQLPGNTMRPETAGWPGDVSSSAMTNDTGSKQTVIVMGGSVLVLLVGLLVAKKFQH